MKNKLFSILLFFAVFAVCCLSGAALANEEKEKKEREKKIFFLSPSVEWYFPSAKKAQDAFGRSWGGLGVDINMEAFGWGDKRPPAKLGEARFSPYFGYFHAEKGNNEAHLIPIGVDVRWMLKEWGNIRAYFGVGLAGYGVKFEDRDAGLDTGWKAAGGGQVLFELDAKWLTLNAAYNAVTDVKEHNLSGFSVGAKINFYF